MTVLIFLVALSILVFVHELGHFIVARLMGMKVHEFGLGFPPRIFSVKRGETLYSLNLLPIGGFVKIAGEDYEEGDEDVAPEQSASGRRFFEKSVWAQIAVLVAGVAGNIIFAWILLSFSLTIGAPASVSGLPAGYKVEDQHTTIVSVVADSPAAKAGLEEGDTIVGLKSPQLRLNTITSDLITNFIRSSRDSLTVTIDRSGEQLEKTITPEAQDGIKQIGVMLDDIGTLHLPIYLALWEGVKSTWRMLVLVVVGFVAMIAKIFSGTSPLAYVSGPVGIAKMVGTAATFGWVYLLSFIAFISVNLAVLNILPIPALDGGRIVFVIIEKIIGKRVPKTWFAYANLIGFVFLLLLIVIVTAHDIWKLIG